VARDRPWPGNSAPAALLPAGGGERAALLDGDPRGVALVAQRFLQREKTFEEIGVFDTRSTWRYRLSRREVVSNAVKYSPTGGDIGVRLTREQGVVRRSSSPRHPRSPSPPFELPLSVVSRYAPETWTVWRSSWCSLPR